MKTKNLFNFQISVKLIFVLTVINFALVVMLPSCASKKEALASKTEVPSKPLSPCTDTEVIDENTPFVVVEEMPVFPGGDSLLLNYIARNTKYPANAKANKIQGRVIVRFCVTKDGGIDRISVIKSVDPELDSESMRVVGTLPDFNPGKQGGKAVPVWYMVPITFTLK
jgi:TonB family protein